MSAGGEINVGELRSRGVVKLKEPDTYALWIKAPCCNMTSRQLRKLADIAEKYGRSIILFTTRQIPMLPFIHFKDVQKVQAEIAEVELMMDRCGPTVRGFNVCYDRGICPEAVTSCLSLGQKMDNFFYAPMRNKVKIGVSGCKKDCVMSRVLTDIGFVAVEKNGEERYDAYVGGRLGLKPFVGIKMGEALSEDESVRLVQNYFDLMNKEGKKDERAADLIARLGADRVRQRLNEDLGRKPGVEPIICKTKLAADESDKTIVRVRATCGEVTSDQLRKIADIAEKYGKGFAHFAVRGSPEIPCVEEANLPNIRKDLRQVGMELIESGIDNLQTCYGNYCTESNADPQSLLRQIEGLVKTLDVNDLNINISASGCPNSCAVAHLNDIGFFGVVEPLVNAEKCVGCDLCVPVCKRHAIQIKDGQAVIDREECRHCGLCITVCPFNALVEGRRGFAALVGGSTGEDTRLGEIIAEFLTEEEALQLTERCLRVLKEKRTSAAKIIDQVGIEKFKEMLVTYKEAKERSR